ncbi:hypothetical protein [Mesorhizobium xinjiangense]|uniref:hypothetical protein n=1 Tax=Mesorhizobium xinjiangense TaxID=2678685 RepID=UPI0012EDDCCC|nr:hypothetical protein [Mesorhizobium xinjiangense]
MTIITSIVDWFDLTRGIAVAGLLLAVFNTLHNYRRDRRQELRRHPRLLPSLVNGFYRSDEASQGRIYALHVTVRNPSDTNNSISEAELTIRYKNAEHADITVRIPANSQKVEQLVATKDDILRIPIQIQAHNTVSGWLYFFVSFALIEGVLIEGYDLILVDTHGDVSRVAPNVMQEFRG